MPLTFGKESMDEGDFAQVICIVSRGDEPLDITWSLHGAVVSSEPSISTNQLGTRTSMLTIQSIGYRHSGFYTCTAKNRAGSSSEVTELKVNGSCGREQSGMILVLLALDFYSKSEINKNLLIHFLNFQNLLS